MSNMSYCRFRNTRLDLGYCLDALADEETLSETERKSGHLMFKEFLNFCMNNGVISGFDADAVENLFRGEEDEGDE